jgi:hypothetical protein
MLARRIPFILDNSSRIKGMLRKKTLLINDGENLLSNEWPTLFPVIQMMNNFEGPQIATLYKLTITVRKVEC